MYNLNSKFNKYYSEKVMLKGDEVKRLRNLKKINLDRLKSGLQEYNEDNKTDYKIAEVLEQGSVAMGTVTQNESKDYVFSSCCTFW